MIRIVEWTDGVSWDSFVTDAKDATIMHLYHWKSVLEESYRVPTPFLAAVDNHTLRAVLPLALVGTPFLGRYLVSMPFMDYGGVCANGDDEAEHALVEHAQRMATTVRATLLLRYLRDPGLNLPHSLDRATMFLTLDDDTQALWRRLPRERRNRVRKAQQCGLTVDISSLEGLPAFYRVFARCMRDLGSPVHSQGFFRNILLRLGTRARILLVRDGTEIIGAGLLLMFAGVVSLPWVASLRQAFHKCPNQMLYWEAMQLAIREGYRVFDFGRSSRRGTYEAKRQWSPDRVQLHWYYHPGGVGTLGADPNQLGWAVRTWQSLPLLLANTLGPVIRRTLPN
jgi:FemAB-related protein (PEP-CTERM system-associated)